MIETTYDQIDTSNFNLSQDYTDTKFLSDNQIFNFQN